MLDPKKLGYDPTKPFTIVPELAEKNKNDEEWHKMEYSKERQKLIASWEAALDKPSVKNFDMKIAWRKFHEDREREADKKRPFWQRKGRYRQD